jgi:release factor glutamine methyltransferase
MPQTNTQQSIEQALDLARALLDSRSTSSTADAEILLCYTLGCARSHLIAWPQKTLNTEQLQRYRELVDLRASGKPVAYLTGVREFWSLSLNVDESTLIPRPETETLVEFILESFDVDTVLDVADLGTGSGAIACALASERARWHIVASDVSVATLAVARDNANRLGLNRIRFTQGDWFDALESGSRFDLIVSNPPYVAAGDAHLSAGDVRFEPPSALVSGMDGLTDIRHIAAQATCWLKPGGWLVLEHGYHQQSSVAAILRDAGFGAIEQRCDLAGIPRMSAARAPVLASGCELA